MKAHIIEFYNKLSSKMVFVLSINLFFGLLNITYGVISNAEWLVILGSINFVCVGAIIFNNLDD